MRAAPTPRRRTGGRWVDSVLAMPRSLIGVHGDPASTMSPTQQRDTPVCVCTGGRACPHHPCASPPPLCVSPPAHVPSRAHPGSRTGGPALTLLGEKDEHPPLRTTPVPPPPLTGPCRTGGSVPGGSVPGGSVLGGSVPIAPLSSGGRRRQLHAPGSVLPPPHKQIPLPPVAGAACEPGGGPGAGRGAAPPRRGWERGRTGTGTALLRRSGTR